MINEEKVKYMTKAAVYESGPEKKNIKIDSYYRGDYLGLQLVKSAFAYAAAFCVLAVLFLMGRSEDIFLKITDEVYLKNILKIMSVLFFFGLVVYEAAVYWYYVRKHSLAKQSVKEFQFYLKHISRFYEEEESSEEKTLDEENHNDDNIVGI